MLVAGLLTGAVAQSSPTAAQDDTAAPFVERFYTKPVQWLINQNIAVNTTHGCFGPDVAVTRGEAAVYLWRLSGKPAAPSHPFADVTNEAQQAAVAWMYHSGITTGTTPTTFAPNQPLNRAQFAALLYRLAGEPVAAEHHFVDVVSGWQNKPVAWLLANKITTGTSPTTFAPNQSVTRGQLATFLYRYRDNPTVAATGHRPTCDLFDAVDSSNFHTCAVRKDQTIVCWGDNSSGQANAPDGQFISVSAGQQHTCAIRTDNTITCWGAHWAHLDGQSGAFTSVSAGGWHSCGVRSSGTITCWGSNDEKQADAPSGVFTSVSASHRHTCGVRSSGTVTCWGSNQDGQTDAPSGVFTSVAAGVNHSCGVRNSGTVTCWGYNLYGQTDAPSGVFTSVAAGVHHSCGVRSSGTVTCWGANDKRQADDPSGEFTAVTSAWEHSCGLRRDSTIACWGNNWNERTNAPEGNFSAISAGGAHSCAIRTDATLTCWGDSQIANDHDPFGSFTSVSAGREHTCAIRSDGTISCWGTTWGERTKAPEGKFTAISSGGMHSCAIRTNKSLTCWGDSATINQQTPVGSFSAVSAGEEHACAIRTNGTIACWGNEEYGSSHTDAPHGQFTAIATGFQHSCAIRSNGTIACWGENWDGQANPPTGLFAGIDAGQHHTCAIRADRTVGCWGSEQSNRSESFVTIDTGGRHTCGTTATGEITCWSNLLRSEPSGVAYVVEYDAVDPTKCRPSGVSSSTTAGFPLSDGSVSAKGTVRVAVLFMDFPNAVASHSTQTEADLGLPWAESYLEAASYGQLDVEFVPLHRWLRAPNRYQHYLLRRRHHTPSSWLRAPNRYQHYLEARALEDDNLITEADVAAVQLADPEVDFSNIDAVMVVMPSSHFRNGYASHRIDTDEGSVARTAVINDTPLTQPSEPYRWGYVAAHELAHNFSLHDLYPYDRRDEPPDPPSGKVWLLTDFGLMGLRVDYLAETTDQALQGIWTFANGNQRSSTVSRLEATEMLAWSRWQLGWLDSNQILCLIENQATVTLGPVAEPGSHLAMAAIPLSATEVIVVESRRRIGYDAPFDESFPDGTVATLPALITEGVLVYIVDASKDSGQLPARIAQDPGNGRVYRYPILEVGQSVTVRGYSITVDSTTDSTHTVTITESGNRNPTT